MSNYRRRLLLANQSEENLYLYGNSVQDRVPTPETPVEILSLENPIIKVDGANYLILEGYTLRGIGNYKDRIYTKEGKVWLEQRSWLYETKERERLNLNGKKEQGLQLFTDANIFDEIYRGIGAIDTKEADNPGLATHFKYDYRAYYPGTGTDYILVTGVRLWLLSDNFESSDDWNTWIKENKVRVVYPLLNPIITEITGTLAEKILAIDKSKNITITSANGVSGSVEVIEE